jgi:hypothetical protein
MKKIAAFGIVLLFLGSSLPVLASHSSSSRTIYVDDDNTQGPWDGTQEHPYQAIQSGIYAASDGDTVFVFNGQYSMDLIITRMLTILGEDKENTIIEGCVTFTQYKTRLSGFTIHSTGGAVKNVGLGCRVENNIIDCKQCGIDVPAGSGTILRNNIFLNTGGAIHFSGAAILVVNNTIMNSTGTAIFAEGVDNVIMKNKIYSCNDSGIVVYSNINLIEKNYVAHCTNYGIFIASVSNIIQKNDFIKNGKNAGFDCGFLLGRNHWKRNYWDDLKIQHPYVIIGQHEFLSWVDGYPPWWIPGFSLPWINIDWLPAKEPYAI